MTKFARQEAVRAKASPLRLMLGAALALFFLSEDRHAAAQVFQEVDGLVVMEIESAPPAGDWSEETSVSGFTGSSYYAWRGPDLFTQPGSGVLSYTFDVENPGEYAFRIRSNKFNPDDSEGNDVWARLDGEEWVKVFNDRGGNDWVFDTRFEFENGDSPDASYNLSTGEHTIDLSGRSNGFHIDRIHLYLPSVENPEDPTLPPSPTEDPPPPDGGEGTVGGELRKWHRVAVSFDGPAASEGANPNPFLDFRLNVVFTAPSGRTIVVPGHYAADGDAAETGATAGGVWRVYFTPDETGTWSYAASFRTGSNIAVSTDPTAGSPTGFDGASGSFTIGSTDKTGRDFRSKGMLRYVGRHHLKFAESGEYYLKGGADSPENFLGYADFDGTFDTGGINPEDTNFLHEYAPHVGDWNAGNPEWQSGKGRGIVGALNYLAGQGMNSVYFLTYNVDGGDGRDTWMWTSPNERLRFDVSKLDQWEIVFSHMDAQGIQLHVVTQETENDNVLDGGGLGTIRKLYYRELVSRFAHHLAVVWNIGEENSNTAAERMAFADFIRDLDPYDHPITVHTFVNDVFATYNTLFGDDDYDATSIQADGDAYNQLAIDLRAASASAGRRWAIFGDEQVPSVLPDISNLEILRTEALWGNLMGGGSGVEWYFGIQPTFGDLTSEDWRDAEPLWEDTRHALEFFQTWLPFPDMEPDNSLVTAAGALALALPGQVYAVYLPDGGTTDLNLEAGNFTVRWYDPRNGGPLVQGSVATVTGPGFQSIGSSPFGSGLDAAALVKTEEELAVVGLTLIDADANAPIAAYDPIPEGATIHLQDLPTQNLNIRANVQGTPGSVVFDYDGQSDFRIENIAPFSVFGDTNGDFDPAAIAPGSHTVTATPFTGENGTGLAGISHSLEFVVSDSEGPPGANAVADWRDYE